jgi:hypothetical protein
MSKEAADILYNSLWGVHKPLLQKHYSFEQRVISAMESYHQQRLEKDMPSEDDLRKNAHKHEMFLGNFSEGYYRGQKDLKQKLKN